MQSCFPAFWSNKTLKIDQVTRILGCPEKPKQKGNGVCSEASYTMEGGDQAQNYQMQSLVYLNSHIEALMVRPLTAGFVILC